MKTCPASASRMAGKSDTELFFLDFPFIELIGSFAVRRNEATADCR